MKILLAGLGSIGQRHARNLRALLGERAELLAYRVRGFRDAITPERGVERDAAGNPVDVEAALRIRTCPSLDDALAERPDAVFVTNPNSLHMPVALAAAAAGSHLFIEKPVSHTLDGIEELAALVESRRLICLVGYQLRFHPAFRKVQAWLAARAVGRVVSARLEFGEYLPGWHPYEDYRQMHASRSDQGGGVILSQIHDLDCAYAMFGLPRRVFAVGGHLSALDIDVEDTAGILMEVPDGDRLFPVHVQQDYLRRPAIRQYDVLGDCGAIRLDLHSGHAERFDAEGRLVDGLASDVSRNDLFLSELRHFLACMRGEERPLVNLREGVQSLRIAMAARTSLATGSVERLP